VSFDEPKRAQQIIDSVFIPSPAASILGTVGEGIATSVLSGTSDKIGKPSPISTPD
jgi:hypothetical protein